jgi:hypothetical protein
MTKKQAVDYAAALTVYAHGLQIERDALADLLEETSDDPDTEIGSLPGSPPPPPPSRPPL